MWGATRSKELGSIYIYNLELLLFSRSYAADLSMRVQAYALHVKSNMLKGSAIYHSLDL